MTTHVVADEQLGQLARKQNDLFRRVREGSLPTGQVLDGLQRLIEGRFGDTVIVPPEVINEEGAKQNIVQLPSHIVTVNNRQRDLRKRALAMKESHGLVYLSDSIDEQVFPTRGKLNCRQEIFVYSPGRLISNLQVERELDERGYKPAVPANGVGKWQTLPARPFWLVFLGQASSNGDCDVMVFYDVDGGLGLRVDCCNVDWGKCHSFAAVRK